MKIPLAERLRPKNLSELAGQDHLLDYLNQTIRSASPHSLLLFGPPGCGKTTLARLYAQSFKLPYITASAVFQSTADLKKRLLEGQENPLFFRQTILFIDEIHRFNRAQQDLFLPFMEDGSLILIGATTENPSFTLNNALLSRLRVLILKPLQADALEKIIHRYETQIRPLPIDEAARKTIIELSQGDGRHLLNMIENLETAGLDRIDSAAIAQFLQKRSPLYDKHQEGHYNLISALHKSIRGSDPDAALYWLSRMLEGGEEPLYIARRLIRMAMEDIGLADPQALPIAFAARQTYEALGSPEGDIALAQVTVYLALAPKSNAVYTAFDAARQAAQKTGHLDPPSAILNAPTQFMKDQGYGDGYIYDHDTPAGFSGQDYFPSSLGICSFYHPVERGFEREMKKRLEYFKKLKDSFNL
ncbi:MAG: rarA [Parachlamydiales bacterium]|nr:rarA [Parachlamydiales bacterium]